MGLRSTAVGILTEIEYAVAQARNPHLIRKVSQRHLGVRLDALDD
jgi:hypothetical protein